MSECIFCKIVNVSLPSNKVYETKTVLAFLDIDPLARGHTLLIPKQHVERMHEIPEDVLSDILPIAKKIALALGIQDYNLLQNNGSIAHQVIKHVHFHLIPKPDSKQGLVMEWDPQNISSEELEKIAHTIRTKIM